MDDYYPDPDDEFDLLHADELEVLNEFDQEDFEPPSTKPPSKSKRSLDFTSPDSKTSDPPNQNVKESNFEIACLASSSSDKSNFVNNHLVHDDRLVNKEDSVVDLELPNENNHVTSQLESEVDCQENNSAKRKVADLFGDIDDIDFGDDFEAVTRNNRSKKSKLEDKVEENLTDEQRMDITIQKILAARHQDKNDNFSVSHVPKRNSRIPFELEASRRVPNYQFISMALPFGEKIYLRYRTEELFNSEVEETSRQTRLGGLLSVPFKKIKEEAVVLLQKKWDAAEQESVALQTVDNRMEVSSEINEELLWVEKYRPKRYLDLLSDEGTNKSLLKWLKLWDKLVFNKENKIKIKNKYEDMGKFGKKFKRKAPESELDDELDEIGRPKFKIALLCGPPGLGKTTLAHILARHAGYNVVEVNASDDRSPEMFKTQLQAATQMRAVMGKDPRPNCLVLDEIDGAPQASIDVLVKFATAKEAAKGKSGKKKSDLMGVLKRPIICICNDVYVPALRPLRQAAFILHFPPTCSYRLAQRLCEISKLQNLKTDLGAMMALSEKTNNDIRACLALLHCLQSKSGNTIRLAQINNASVGTKDIQKGLFTVWQEIFQIKKANRWKSVLQTVQVCGDYDRLAQGVYENYLTLKGASLKKISEGMNWFVYYDILSSAIHSSQNYTVFSYLPYPFLKWHFTFAGRFWPKISFPSLGFELTSKSTKNSGILDDMLQGMSPNVRPYEHRETLLLDVLALLMEIIVPNLRPVNIQLYNDQEKKDLSKVVNIMIDYNLNYTQERLQDGSYVFKLDPNIEEVAKFPGWKPIRNLGYAGRQQVQRAIDLERIKRLEERMKQSSSGCSIAASSGTGPVKESKTVQETKSDTVPLKKEENKKIVPNHLQKLTPKALIKPTETVCRDFFGRVVEKQSVVTSGGPVPGKDVWFRFKEGYNNAVRLRVNMSDLY